MILLKFAFYKTGALLACEHPVFCSSFLSDSSLIFPSCPENLIFEDFSLFGRSKIIPSAFLCKGFFCSQRSGFSLIPQSG